MGSLSSTASAGMRRLADSVLVIVVLSILGARAVMASGDNLDMLPDAPNPPEGTDYYLEVVLNQSATGYLAHVIQQGQSFHMPAKALEALSFKLPRTTGWVRLQSISGLTARLDQGRQILELQAPLDALNLETRSLNQPVMAPLEVDSAAGVVINYDVFADRPEGMNTRINGLLETRVFGDFGLLTNDMLGFTEPQTGIKPWVRLDTAWRYSDPEALTTFQLGDGITRGLSWSRPTRFAGLQYSRNFSLQPDLITFPIPEFAGQAALPSTVELYVNGVRQFQDRVTSGPFEIAALPSVNQRGQATLVVTDTLGRQSVTVLPVYASSQLLRPGLTDYSVELGYVRQNFGVKSADYGDDLIGSTSVRHGLNEFFTLEGHAEATRGLAMLGGGTALRLEEYGVFNAAFSLSSSDEQLGQQGQIGYEWHGRWVGVNLSTTQASEDYHDVASFYGRLPFRRTDRAFLSLRLGQHLGAITMGYVRLKSQETGALSDDSRLASVFYSLPLSMRLNFFASVTEDLDDEDRTNVFAGLNYAWGGNSYALSASRQGDSQVEAFQANRPIPIDGGFGWRALAENGDRDLWQLESGYRGDYGQLNAGVAEFAEQKRYFASLSGALIGMDNDLFLSRRISDAFALVSTNGTADVPVLLENREIGYTDSRGYYLLTPLSSYQDNRISIDPGSLPEDVYFDAVDKRIVPSERAGAQATFHLRRRKSATLLLQMPDGSDVPVGQPAYLNTSETVSGYVGYDGQLYIQGLEAENRLQVKLPDEQDCLVSFSYTHKPGTVPTLGPFVCE